MCSSLSLLVSQTKFVACPFGWTIVQLSVYSNSVPDLFYVLITNQLIQISGADVAHLPAFPFIVSKCPSSVLVFFFSLCTSCALFCPVGHNVL